MWNNLIVEIIIIIITQAAVSGHKVQTHIFTYPTEASLDMGCKFVQRVNEWKKKISLFLLSVGVSIYLIMIIMNDMQKLIYKLYVYIQYWDILIHLLNV